MDLKEEAKQATKLLIGKTVNSVLRHREDEVVIKFDDGTTLYVDVSENSIKLSITGGE